jgi:uncharacterized protein YkvS
MEQKRNNALRLAVAACFGVVANQAGAAVIGTSNTNYALEIPSNATLVQAATELQININTIPGLVPTATTPMFVKVNLLNGATWGTAPILYCSTAVANANPVTGTVDLGGTVGGNSVTFRMTGGGNAMSGACTVSANSITVSGLTTKTVSAQIEYTNGATTVTTAQVGNYITFQRGLSTVVSAPATGVVVDATSGSDNWAVGSNLTVGTAYIGRVVYGQATGVTNGNTAYNSAGVTLEGSSAFSTAVLTVSGPAIAASMSRGVSGIYLSTVSGCSDLGVTAAFTNSASTTSVTFAGLTPTVLSAGVFICATVPGNVVITTGQLTATITSMTPLAATQTGLDASAASNNVANVTANGSTRNGYFVNASTSTSKTSVLRLINRSGIAGVITATAYDETGARVGTANASLGNLAINQMMTKTSADLEAAIGYTPASATAKYSIVFSGALPSFEVLNFSKDVASGSVNLSNTSTTNTQ